MKQLLKLVVIGTLLLLTFCAGSAFADRFADTYVDEPPVEVLLHIQEKYSDYLMEDYITISGTSKGDYGFALMSQNGHRVLLGYHDDGSGMKYWIRNSDAVPQGDGYVYFKRHANSTYISHGNATATYDNALGFDVIRIDKEHEEYWSQTVCGCHAGTDASPWYAATYEDGLALRSVGRSTTLSVRCIWDVHVRRRYRSSWCVANCLTPRRR